MAWDRKIQTGVNKNNGQTLVLYRQGLDIRTKVGGSYVSSGWCLGMSICWVIQSANGNSFWSWFKPPAQACPSLADRNGTAGVGTPFVTIKALMKQDAKLIEQKNLIISSGVNALAILNWFAPKVIFDTPCQRTRGGDGLQANVVDGTKIGKMITKTSGYKIISMFGSRGGHAMAARVIDGSVVLMDPNYGEFFFPDFGNFETFMGQFWRICKYSPGFTDLLAVTSFSDPAGSIGEVSF